MRMQDLSGDSTDNTISVVPLAGMTAGPRFYFLVIRSETSSILPLKEDGELLIGRASESDVRIPDQSASRQHARILLSKGTVTVVDLGSRNRTWVNGEPIPQGQKRTLASGDVVTIGSLTLVLHRTGVMRNTPQTLAPMVLEMGDGATLLADPAMVRLYELLRRLARSMLPILITGETGTGKENAAQAVHHFSARSAGPLVCINCAAVPDNLFESELFGHVRGAFSGATGDKLGRLENASGGTVFLDEIGELPLAAQAKILRVLETGMLSPLGSLRERKIDCRLVTATNRDLELEVKAGRFREDLFFRLAAATVTLPPLRERPAEIPLLAERFLILACRKLGRTPLAIADKTKSLLGQHSFPGNVRELRNLMDYCAATATEDAIQPWHLPPRFAARATPSGLVPGSFAPTSPPIVAHSAVSAMTSAPESPTFRNIAVEVEELEQRRMREALEATGGNQKRAAQLIGMPLRTFVAKLKQYGLRDK
jgi:two-component system response regulator AtoC